jgi:hypothetical protein
MKKNFTILNYQNKYYRKIQVQLKLLGRFGFKFPAVVADTHHLAKKGQKTFASAKY